MPDRRVLPATTAVLAACFTVAACDAGRRGADADTAPAVLRTYHVPVEHQNEVHTALRTALGITTDNPFGRVSLGPGGTLIVVAPEPGGAPRSALTICAMPAWIGLAARTHLSRARRTTMAERSPPARGETWTRPE